MAIASDPEQHSSGAHTNTITRQRGVASGREFVALITALMATGALAIDVMLPAFPNIREEFGMSPDSTQVAWVLTSFFLGMAIGPWLYGPISDRYGRRTPLFVGLFLYVAAGVLASVASSWAMLVFARFLWGVAAASPRSLATAMIRDRYQGSEMARLMSMIMAVFLLVPIIAPTIGAGLIALFPWRTVFWFPSIIGVLLIFWSRRLPETLDPANRRPFTFSAVATAGREVMSHRQTMSFTIAITFLFGVMMTYLAGSEVIVEDVYDYGTYFPFFFGAIAVLLAINSLNNARLVERFGVANYVRRLSIIAICTSTIFVFVSLLNGGKPNFWLFTIALAAVVPLAQGLVPICNTAAMMPVPHVAGTASAIIATITTAGGAVLGNIASAQFDGTVRPFAIALLVFILLATVLIYWGSADYDEHQHHS